MSQFNLAKARASGKSDAQITNYLIATRGDRFKIQDYLNRGATLDQIVEQINLREGRKAPEVPEVADKPTTTQEPFSFGRVVRDVLGGVGQVRGTGPVENIAIEAAKFGRGAVQEPAQTALGLGVGFPGAPLGAPALRITEEEVKAEKKKRGAQFGRSVEVGKGAANAVTSGVLYATVPGAWWAKSLASELPWAIDAIQKRDPKGLFFGAIIGMTVDKLSAGMARKPLQEFLERAIRNRVDLPEASIRALAGDAIQKSEQKLLGPPPTKKAIENIALTKIPTPTTKALPSPVIRGEGFTVREAARPLAGEPAVPFIAKRPVKVPKWKTKKFGPTKDFVTWPAPVRKVKKSTGEKIVLKEGVNPGTGQKIVIEHVDDVPQVTGKEHIELSELMAQLEQKAALNESAKETIFTRIADATEGAWRPARNAFESVRHFLVRLSPQTKELANALDEINFQGRRLSGEQVHTVVKATQNMSNATNDIAFDILDGGKMAALEGRTVAPTPEATRIAQIIRPELDKTRNLAVQSGVKEKVGNKLVDVGFIEDYVPYWKRPQVTERLEKEIATYRKNGTMGTWMNEGVEWLMRTGQAKSRGQAVAQIAGSVGFDDKPLIKRLADNISKETGASADDAVKQAGFAVDQNLDPFFGSLERPRGSVTLPRDWYIRDLNILVPNYISKGNKRAITSKIFPSTKGKGVSEWVRTNRADIESMAKAAGEKNPSKIYQEIRDIVEEVAGDRPGDKYSLFRGFRRLAGKTLVGWNPTSPPANALRGMIQQFLMIRPSSVLWGTFKAMKQANKDIMNKLGLTSIDAQRSISLMVEQPELTRLKIPRGVFNTALDWVREPWRSIKEGPFLTFMRWGEGIVRTGSGFAIRPYANDLAKKAWGAPSDISFIAKNFRTLPKKKASAALERMGIKRSDYVNGNLTEDALDRASMFASDKTQGQTGLLDMPRFAESEAGQLMITLAKMTYRLTAELTSQIKAGNWQHVWKYLAAAGMGEATIMGIRRYIYNRNNPNYQPTEDDTQVWMDAMGSTFLLFGTGAEMLAGGRRQTPAALVTPKALAQAPLAAARGDSEKALKELGRAFPLLRAIRGK